MTQLVLTFAIIGTILSTTLAAPWVVLDSRNDMLAMSSEISDSVVAYAVPPPETTLGSIDDEAVTSEPESVAEISDDKPVTTEEQPQADPTPEPEPEISPAESDAQDVVQTTTSPLADGIQEDGIPDVTTNLPASSSSVSSMLEDDIQSEDIHLKVVPDTPIITSSRQNPNSIEEDEQMAAVVVVSKKKHDIFNGKKSKFSF